MIARMLLLVCLAGCRREEATPQLTSAASSTPVAPPSVSALPSPSTKHDDATARAVVAEWNDAVNTKNEAALKKVYAKSVTYYGNTLDGNECTKRIMTALAKDPSYQQNISIEATSGSESYTVVSFKKTFHATTVDGYITVDTSKRLVVLESDKTTDANLAKMKKCLTYGPISISGKIGHAVGPGEEWWTLDTLVPCIVKGDFEDPYVSPRLDDIYLELHSNDLATLKPSANGYVITGDLVPRGKHQDASIEVKTIKPL